MLPRQRHVTTSVALRDVCLDAHFVPEDETLISKHVAHAVKDNYLSY